MLLFKWIRSFQHSRDQFLVLCNGVCFIRPKLPLFSHPPTLFLQGLRFLNQVSFLLMRSLFILFFQCSYPVISHEDTNGASSLLFFVFFLLRWTKFKPSMLVTFLSLFSNVFLVPVHLLIIHFSLFNCSGVLKMPQEIRVSTPHQF